MQVVEKVAKLFFNFSLLLLVMQNATFFRKTFFIFYQFSNFFSQNHKNFYTFVQKKVAFMHYTEKIKILYIYKIMTANKTKKMYKKYIVRMSSAIPV